MDYGAFFDELGHIKEAGLPRYLKEIIKRDPYAGVSALNKGGLGGRARAMFNRLVAHNQGVTSKLHRMVGDPASFIQKAEQQGRAARSASRGWVGRVVQQPQKGVARNLPV